MNNIFAGFRSRFSTIAPRFSSICILPARAPYLWVVISSTPGWILETLLTPLICARIGFHPKATQQAHFNWGFPWAKWCLLSLRRIFLDTRPILLQNPSRHEFRPTNTLWSPERCPCGSFFFATGHTHTPGGDKYIYVLPAPDIKTTVRELVFV